MKTSMKWDFVLRFLVFATSFGVHIVGATMGAAGSNNGSKKTLIS